MNRWTIRRWITFCILVCPVLMTACWGRGTTEFVGHTASEEKYMSVLERWTDEHTVYLRLETKLHVAATYKSEGFRRAYAEKYAEDYEMTAAESAKMNSDQTSMAQNSIEFLVAVSGPDKKDINLASRETSWEVFLEGGAIPRMTPFEIRPVKKTSKLESFYPFISPWDKVYQIRFLISDPPPIQGELNLVLTSVSGTARLVYRLEN